MSQAGSKPVPAPRIRPERAVPPQRLTRHRPSLSVLGMAFQQRSILSPHRVQRLKPKCHSLMGKARQHSFLLGDDEARGQGS